MARERLKPGSHSNITVAKYVEDGVKANGAKRYRIATEGEEPTKFRAYCRYRDKTGHIRMAQTWRDTSGAAESALRNKLIDLTSGALDRANVTVKTASQKWLERFQIQVDQGKVRQQTFDLYEDAADRMIIPALGGLLMTELTTGRITEALDNLHADAPSNARRARVVLKHITKFAMQQDWIDKDPMTGTDTYRPVSKSVDVITVDDLKRVRQAVKAWQSGNRYGPPRGAATLDVLDFMLGTGCRPGEALAVRWQDLELGNIPTVTICGTIVSPVKGSAYRQDWTKTASGFRQIILPRSLRAMLMRRAGEATSDTYVFPARGGGCMSPNNFRRGLRDALRQADLEGFYLYLLRKKAATHIADTVSLEAAAANLGHTDTAVTRKHYAARPVLAPDVSDTMEDLLSSLD